MLARMRALVTGGTGFIGSNLALTLQELGHDMRITGTAGEQDLPTFRARLLPHEFWTIDWGQLGLVDVLFHQAAVNDTTLLDRNEMFRVNVDGTLALLREAVAHGVRRIVYASSCAVYGDLPAPYREDGPLRPLNPYAESKVVADAHAMAFARLHPEVTIVGLRYSNVYGPREAHKGKRATMITQFAHQMLLGNPRLFQWGEQKRDYIAVEDAVRANLLAASAQQSGIVNCGSGNPTTFNDLVTILNEALGLQRTPAYIDNPYAERYQSHTECDMTRARDLLGFVPEVDIRTGIRRYAESGFLVPRGAPARLSAASG